MNGIAVDPELRRELLALHRRHAARFGEILTKHGWPGRTLVGDDG
jgi:hypothetical protein